MTGISPKYTDDIGIQKIVKVSFDLSQSVYNDHLSANVCSVLGTFMVDLVKLPDISIRSIYMYILEHKTEFFTSDIPLMIQETFKGLKIPVITEKQTYLCSAPKYVVSNIRLFEYTVENNK